MLGIGDSFGWCLFALQIFGLFTVLLARSTAPCVWRLGTFIGSLIAIGVTTAFYLCQGDNSWVPCGSTFSLMVVGAVLDGGRVKAAAF